MITDGPGWRWLFWINIPLGIAAYLAIHRLTPESSDPGASRKVDWLGLATIGLAVFALLYALTDGPAVGWGDPVVVGLLIAAVVLAVAWVLIERRVTDPLVDLKLFRLRSYDGALTANLSMNLAFAGLSYLLVLWLQNARGHDAVEAGLLMLPSTLGIFLFIPLGGRLDERLGGRAPVLGGLLIMSAGFFVLTWLTADSSLWLLAVALVVIGLGLGLLSTPISNTAVGGVPVDLAGSAAGVFKMSSMVGGALGVAVLSALARGFVERDSEAAFDTSGLSDGQVEKAQNALVNSSSFTDAIASMPHAIQQTVTDAVVKAFSDGVADTMVATGVISVLATVVVAFLWPRRGANDGGSPAPGAGDPPRSG